MPSPLRLPWRLEGTAAAGRGAAAQAGTTAGRVDLNGDGWTDLLWHHQTDGRIAAWLMQGLTQMAGTSLTPDRVADTDWKALGAGDLDGDGGLEIVWHDVAQPRTSAWMMDGLTVREATVFGFHKVPDTNWRIASVGDLNGDGRDDLIWHHRGDGSLAAWLMNGLTVTSGTLLNPSRVPDTNWWVVGSGDFNADGRRDLVWHHQQDGRIAVWFMNGTTQLGGTMTRPSQVPDTTWKIRGVGDMNGDGHPDLIWQNTADGRVAVWLMRGLDVIDGIALSVSAPDTNWHIVGPR